MRMFFRAEKTVFKLLYTLFLAATVFNAHSEQYVLGGKNGWSEIAVHDGTTGGIGRHGNASIELATNSNILTDDTDLMLDFEGSSFEDVAKNYSVVKNFLHSSGKAKMGKESALSRNRGGLILSGKHGSLFGTEGPAGSFIIEFWLCPSVVENGEIIMNWRSSRTVQRKIIYQQITISVHQNRLMCSFSNIFEGYAQNGANAVLQGENPLIPGKWSHHSIRFEEETGAFSYSVSGYLSDIKFITESGHQWGTIYQAVLGESADFEICPNYTGLVDDVKITRSYEGLSEKVSENSSDLRKGLRYRPSGGRFESRPILTGTGTTLNRILADMDVPDETDIKFYVRGGDNYFSWTDEFPEWIPVKIGENIENLSGLYFQVAAELFPSGDGEKTPSITELRLDCTSLPEPEPPYRITAQKGDGSVTLAWTHSVCDTTGGYYVYYGSAPGEYLGRTAVEGASPVNVGNSTTFTLTGLQNGSIYYFAVAAWSKIDRRMTGPLSKEVHARPGR